MVIYKDLLNAQNIHAGKLYIMLIIHQYNIWIKHIKRDNISNQTYRYLCKISGKITISTD